MTTMTIARLHELLEYDPATGCFRWRNPHQGRGGPSGRSGAKQAPGWFKGNKSVRQYRRLYIDGRHVMAHRVAWALMTGEWPTEIDHRDRNQANNVWTNLRLATREQQGRNRSVGKNSTTGVVGVTRYGQKFRAVIVFNGKTISLGLYPTVALAAAARRKKAKELDADYFQD
jgi:hypothetical protein